MFLFSGNLWIDTICIAATVLTVIYTYFKWTYQIWKRKNIPYLEPTFPFGSIQPLYKDGSFPDKVFEAVKTAKARGWDLCGMFIIVNPFFVPLDLDLVKSILTKDFNNFVDRGSYHNEKDDPLSAHLFAVGGQKWKNLRVKLTPTFTSGKMKAMFPTFVSGYSALEKAMEERIGKGPTDIKSILENYTMDMIGSCAFGLDCNSFTDTDSPFIRNAKRIFQRSLFEQLHIQLTDAFPKMAKTLHRKVIPTEVTKFFYDIVNKAISYREKNNYTRSDFLQLLIDMRKNTGGLVKNGDNESQITLDEMVAQSFVFFIAGYETTSTTMTFTLYELSRNLDIQEKVRQEMFSVFKKYNNEYCYDATKELVYLQQVLDETLRKYPAVPFITRACVEDYKIPKADVILEKGTNVLIPIKNFHYDANVFPNPEVFDPERFSSENKNTRHPYAHIPFGEGPRMCIGMRFALLETKLTLAKILTKFRVKLNPKTSSPLKMSQASFVPLAEGGIWLDPEKI